jgi:catechol 2,3-dioxygenase-like lactoylglutathione lyase family enzyme
VSLAKIGQIILPVKDLNSAASFYQGLLGMKVKYTVPGEFVFLDGGGIELALREMEGGSSPDLTEVVFQVDDVFATYESLRSKGIAFSYPPRAITGSPTAELFATDFRDPDGHVLSITGWVQKK